MIELWTAVLRTFVQYLITFSSQQEAVSHVNSRKLAGPIVLDKSVKFRDHSLNRSREILLEAEALFSTVFRGITHGSRTSNHTGHM